MLQGLATASPLYLYPLAAGLLLAVLQIMLFFVGGFPAGDAIADLLEGSSVADYFDWLNLGRVPMSVILILLLVTFGVTGLFLSAALPAFPIWVFVFAAVPAALVVTRSMGNLIVRILPPDHTFAVQRSSLVGRTGVVTLGPLDDAMPGNIRVRDEHGEFHTVRARPVDAGTVIERGAEVVVVSSENDEHRIFLVMPFAASEI